MRSSLVVRASDCQCTSCNGPGFDPSIRRHSGIWGAADEAVLKIVWKKYPPKNIFKKEKGMNSKSRMFLQAFLVTKLHYRREMQGYEWTWQKQNTDKSIEAYAKNSRTRSGQLKDHVRGKEKKDTRTKYWRIWNMELHKSYVLCNNSRKVRSINGNDKKSWIYIKIYTGLQLWIPTCSTAELMESLLKNEAPISWE